MPAPDRDLAKLLRCLLCLAALAAALPAGAAGAADAPKQPESRLKEVESELKKGEAERDAMRQKETALTREMAETKAQMVAAARAVQEHEETLSELEAQLADLAQVEKTKMAALDLKRQQMNGVLTALQRLAFRPSEALIAQPTSPADTVRSAILLRDVVPKIDEEAASLKTELASLAQFRSDMARQKKRVTQAAGKLDSEHKRLASLYDKKEVLQHDVEGKRKESERHIAALASEASDLRDLLTRIEEERKRAEAEAKARAEAEKVAREAARAAARAAAKAAREAEIAAQKAAREAELQAARAAKEKRVAEAAQAEQARETEMRAKKAAELAQAKADRADREIAEASKANQKESGKTASFSRAQGEMPFPARGQIVTRFGQTDGSGQAAKGLSIATRDGAQVIAPFDGQIVFAGPFRGYGLLLIIEHGEGYHTLLAGMARIDGVVGQHLVAGEPVGVMGQSDDKPLLYCELRHNGQPVNPLPWLTARKTRVSG